jgi:ATP synthase protein I
MASNSGENDDDAALRARLDRLAGAIEARRPAARPTPGVSASNGSDGMGSAISMGLRAGSEFVAAILVGGGIGWGLDWALRTRPAFTIVFFFLGVAAGVWNVIRATSPRDAALVRNSRLSGAKAEAKDVPRGTPEGDGWDEG